MAGAEAVKVEQSQRYLGLCGDRERRGLDLLLLLRLLELDGRRVGEERGPRVGLEGELLGHLHLVVEADDGRGREGQRDHVHVRVPVPELGEHRHACNATQRNAEQVRTRQTRGLRPDGGQTGKASSPSTAPQHSKAQHQVNQGRQNQKESYHEHTPTIAAIFLWPAGDSSEMVTLRPATNKSTRRQG